MKKLLTDLLLRTMAAPEKGRVEISDERCAGLEFRVTANSAKSFSFRFRDPVNGRPSRALIGRYPDISLSQARQAADKLRSQIANGFNPVVEKRRLRAEASTRTFEALAERYLEEHARRHKRSASADERNLKLHILPRWNGRHYDSIKRSDVIELTEALVKQGSPIQANRMQALISSIYSFAVDADLLQLNPCLRLKKRGRETPRTRVLSDPEIRLFWERAVQPPISLNVGLALRLTLLTGARAGEIAGMRFAELENVDDPQSALWTLPATRSKNRVANLVPLSELAVRTIRSVNPKDGHSDYVFPSPTKEKQPIAAHALAVAMQRLSRSMQPNDGPEATWRASPPSPHDLRRTTATRLSSLGIPQEDVSAVLNHIRRDITGRSYDMYRRGREKRFALTLWAEHIEKHILSGIVP